jgi:hypothetical protein
MSEAKRCRAEAIARRLNWGRDRRTIRRKLEPQYDSRELETWNRHPEQRAVHRSPDLEPTALRQEYAPKHASRLRPAMMNPAPRRGPE